MGRGRRYDGGEPRLNIKKVIATILVLIVIIMAVVLIIKMPKNTKKVETKNVANSFISVYTNGKWGVINSEGKIILEPTYELSWDEPEFIGVYCKLNFGYGMVYYTKQVNN